MALHGDVPPGSHRWKCMLSHVVVLKEVADFRYLRGGVSGSSPGSKKRSADLLNLKRKVDAGADRAIISSSSMSKATCVA
ncbi:hypothetical protein ACLK1T_10810 [Escherichia coli]